MCKSAIQLILLKVVATKSTALCHRYTYYTNRDWKQITGANMFQRKCVETLRASLT